MGPKVLLTTTVNWPSSARLAGAFANVGAQVEALLPAGHVAAASRYLTAIHAYRPLFPLTSLSAAIERARPDLVVPCDDRAIAQLLALNGNTEVLTRSFGRVENYGGLIARATFIETARAAGIAAPHTVCVAAQEGLDAALSRIGFPAVLKADGSWGGEGVAIVRSLEQAHDAFRKFSSAPSRLRSLARAVKRRDLHFVRDALHPPKPAVSLQQFIPGTPATTALACWKGRVLAIVHMEVLETMGPTGPASVMRRVECPQREQAAIRLAERFGLSGLHGLDFVRDGEGKAWLIEINPRATQASALAFGPGRDLPAALAGAVSPGFRGARPAVTDNPIIALFPQEWRRNPKSSWLSMAYLDAPWDDPAMLQACLAPGDPPAAPGRAFVRAGSGRQACPGGVIALTVRQLRRR